MSLFIQKKSHIFIFIITKIDYNMSYQQLTAFVLFPSISTCIFAYSKIKTLKPEA